jgi:hypothetical protein
MMRVVLLPADRWALRIEMLLLQQAYEIALQGGAEGALHGCHEVQNLLISDAA